MSEMKRRLQERDDRRSAIEAIGTDLQALEVDELGEATSSIEDEEATKKALARVFAKWAAGNISGTADEVFNDAKEILEIPDSL